MQRNYIVHFLFLITSVNIVRASNLDIKQVPVINTTEELHQKWRIIENNLRNGVDSILRYILPLLTKAKSDLNVTEQCSKSIHTTVSALRNFKPWAYHMMDSTGKIPSGVFTGTVTEFGAYDQCLNLKYKGENDTTQTTPFSGQYCILDLQPPLPPKPSSYRLHQPLPEFENFTTDFELIREFMSRAHGSYFTTQQLGICVPSTCSKEDIEEITSLVQTGVYVSVPRCEVKEEATFRIEQTVIIAVLCVMGLLVLLGSLADKVASLVVGKVDETLDYSEATGFERVVAAFSLDANLKKLVRIDNENPLNFVNGLKFISLTWVIVGQTYFLTNWQLLRNLHPLTQEISTFAFQAVTNAYVSVDTFFFIGGLLVCYTTVKLVDKHGKEAFSVLCFMLHRLWRYIPGFLIAIGLTLLLPLIGSGPVWHDTIDRAVAGCRKSFWSNLILANNFISLPNACLPYSWYSAVDFQLYQLVPLFFLLLFKRQLFGLIFIVILIVGSVVSVGVINVLKGYPPVPLAALPDIESQVDLWQNLNKAHPYMGPYAVGLAVGLILVRNPKIPMSTFLQVLGWPLAIVCNLAVLYAPYRWNGEIVPGVVESTLYAGLHRTTWAVGIGWLTLMCATGRAGPVKTFLSWNCFGPLSRLTHLAYLLHYLVILVYMGNLRGKIDGHQMVMAWMSIGNIAVTYGLAFVCYLFFEAPLLELFDILMGYLRCKPCKRKEKKSLDEVISEELTLPKKPAVESSQGIVNVTFDERL